MHTKCFVLALLLLVAGCAQHLEDRPLGQDSMSRERMVAMARTGLQRAGLLDANEPNDIVVEFDEGNTKWQTIMTDLSRRLPEQVKYWHKHLDGKPYQAIHFRHEHPTIGGTYWVFIDTNARVFILFVTGV